MEDLIERARAIDAIEKNAYRHTYLDQIIDIIKALPPAQPERTQERTETHGVCLDAIDRQAAIDALDKRFDSIPMEQTTEILLLRKDLRELPSAQPEIVRCKDCMYWVAHDKRCVYLNHGFAPNMWCCHGRKTDENEDI